MKVQTGVELIEFYKPSPDVIPLNMLSFNNMWSLLAENESEVQYVYESTKSLPAIDFTF